MKFPSLQSQWLGENKMADVKDDKKPAEVKATETKPTIDTKPVEKKATKPGKDYAAILTGKISALEVIYVEKGFEPFKIPVLVTAGICFALYYFIYKPIAPKISEVQAQFDLQQAISENINEYKDIKSMIATYKKKLPMYKDKDNWLSYLIMTTSKNLNIQIESISPQKIEEQGNVAVASRSVETTLDYDTAGKWIAALENSEVIVRITSFKMEKIPTEPSLLKLSMDISTVFLKEQGAAQAGAKK